MRSPRALLLTCAPALLALSAEAQTTVWTGAANTTWSNAANWDNGVPTATTDAVVAPAANQPSTFIVHPECRDLTIEPLATLSLGGGFDLTVHGGLSISGTLDVASSSSEVAVAGDWTNDGTYSNGGGSVELTATGALGGASATTFADLVVSGGTRTATTGFTVSGDVSVEGGVSLVLGAATYAVGGNWTSSAPDISVTGAGTIEFTGDGVLTTASNPVPNVLVSSGVRSANPSSIAGDLVVTGGELRVLDDAVVSVGGDADLTGGVLGFTGGFASPEVLDVEGNCTVTATAGSFGDDSVIRCAGDWSSTSAFAPAAGTVELDGGTTRVVGGTSPAFANVSVVSGAKTFDAAATLSGDLSIETGASLTTTAALDVDGRVLIGDATASWDAGNVTHTVAGNWSASGGSATGEGTIEFDGSGGLLTGGGALPSVHVSAGTRSVFDATVNGDLTMTAGAITIFDNQTLTVSGSCDLSGGTLSFDHVSPGNEVLDVEGDVSLSATSGATSPQTVIRCAGDWTSTSAFAPALGRVVLDGGTTASVGGTAPVFPTLHVASGAKSLSAASTVSGDLVISPGGTLDSVAALDVEGDVSLADGTSGWALGAVTHTVGGSWTSTGGSATGGGTVELDGAGGTLDSGGGTISNVLVSSGSYLVQTTTITGDLAMTAGALDVQDGQTLAVLGNASLTGGTLGFTSSTAASEVLDVDGDLTLDLTAGATSAETIVRCGGNYSTSAAFAPAEGLFELDGASAATFGGVGIQFPNLTIASGTKTLTDACSIAADLRVLDGATLDSDASMDVDGRVVLGHDTSAWDIGSFTHTVAGNFASSGGSATGTGTVEFDGPGGLITGGGSIANMAITAGTRSVLDTIVDGDVAMTAGALVLFDGHMLAVGGDLSLTGGTLTFEDSDPGLEVIDVEGDVTIDVANGGTTSNSLIRAAGNWTSTSAWAPTAGAVELDGGTMTAVDGSDPIFHHLAITSGTKQVLAAVSVQGDLGIGDSSTLDSDAPLDVDGDVEMTATSIWDLGMSTHTVAGDLVTGGGSATGTGTIEFDAGGVLETGAGSVPNVVSSAGIRVCNDTTITGNLSLVEGGLTIADNQTLAVGGSAVLSGGDLSFDDQTPGLETFDIDGDATIGCSAGAHNANSVIRCAGNWSSVAVYAPDGGTVELDGGTMTTVGGANATFYDLDVVSGTKTVTSTIHVQHDLSLADGAALDADAAVDVDGEVLLGDATAVWDVGASTHTVAGSWTSSGCSAVGSGTIEFDGPGTLLPTTGTLPNVHVSSGMRVCFGTTITGDLTLTGGGMRIEHDRAVNVAGNASLTAGTLTWLGDGFGTDEGFDVEGDVTVHATVAGETSDSVFYCGGNWTSDGSFAPSLVTVELDGAGSTTIDGSGTMLGNLVVAGGTKTLLSPATVAGDLTVANGTAVVCNAAWDVGGGVSLGDATASLDLGAATHRVVGDWTSAGAAATGAGTVRFDGAGLLHTAPGTVPNVEVVAGVRQVGDTTITGDLTVTAGGMTVEDDATVAVQGDLAFTGGTLAFDDASAGLETIDVEGDVQLEATAGAHSANSRIHCAGSWSGHAGYSPTAGTVVLDGAGATTIGGSGAGDDPVFDDLVLTGGPRSASNDFTLNTSTLSIESTSSFDVGARTVSLPAAAVIADGALSVAAGGRLRLGAGTAVSIPSGGTLSVVGAPGDPAVVEGHAGGGYVLNVDGTLEAGEFAFSEMGVAGIIVNSSASFGSAPNDLRSGVFSDPSATLNSVMLDIRRPSPTDFRYVDFDDAAGVGTYNVRVFSGSSIRFINSSGSFSGAAFEQDPFDLVDWDVEGSVLSAFSATPGPDQVTIDWTTSAEIDVANFVVSRATNFAGPFTPIATPAAAGPGPYQHVDGTVTPGQLYVYRLSEDLLGGGVQQLAEGIANPWGGTPPPNFLTVGSGGAFLDIQSALSAAAGIANPVVSVAPGTYPPFTLTPLGSGGTIRVTGDGTGPVLIDTTTGPVEILNMGFFDSVELADMEIGSGSSGNPAVLVRDNLGVVVLDGLTAHGGGAGFAGIDVDNSQSVAIQKCSIDGDSGLVVQNGSVVVASLGSLDDLAVLTGSDVRTAELPTSSTVDPGAFLTEFPGEAADVEFPRLVSIGAPFSIELSGKPNAAFLLLLGTGMLWLDLAADAEMVGLQNLVPGTVLFSGALSGAGTTSLPQTMPESGGFYGKPVLLQMVQVDPVTLGARWSSLATLIGTH